MNKKVSAGVLLVHLFWALSWGVGAYYIEYGIMSLFAAGGVSKVVSANVAGGAILFLVFYLIERKLVEEEVTQRGLFIFATYVIPILYQLIMINVLQGTAQNGEEIVSFMFIFTFILLLMGLFFRGMLEFVNYYRLHIKVKR